MKAILIVLLILPFLLDAKSTRSGSFYSTAYHLVSSIEMYNSDFPENTFPLQGPLNNETLEFYQKALSGENSKKKIYFSNDYFFRENIFSVEQSELKIKNKEFNFECIYNFKTKEMKGYKEQSNSKILYYSIVIILLTLAILAIKGKY